MQLFLGHVLNNSIQLHKDEVKHATRVLRKQPGDTINVIDGQGNLYACQITHTTKSVVEAAILSTTKQFGAIGYELHVAIAPTKLIDRLEWFLEKATEMGVSSIYPIVTAHSERQVIKPERLEKILLSATKQSLKGRVPTLHPLLKWKDFLAQDFKGDKFIAHCADGEKQELAAVINHQTPTLICIGPEGDFDAAEVAMAQQCGFVPVKLGQSRLRTETAGLVAVSAMYNAAVKP